MGVSLVTTIRDEWYERYALPFEMRKQDESIPAVTSPDFQNLLLSLTPGPTLSIEFGTEFLLQLQLTLTPTQGIFFQVFLPLI